MSDRPARAWLAALFAPIVCLIRSGELVQTLCRQRIALRYRGSLFGIAWALLSPALSLGLFTLVFGVIFAPRWKSEETGTMEYALLLYLGLCAYWFVSECVAEAPGLVVGHAHYVKKVVFPLDVLAWVSISTASFHGALRLLVYGVALVALEGRLPPTIALLPLVWVPLVLLALGLSWLLSALGVFVRDLGEVVTFALTAMLFLSPVFYPIESVPESFRWLIELNPLTRPIAQLREVAYLGTLPDLRAWLGLCGVLYVFAWLGHRFFLRSRRDFSDVV